MRKFLAAIALMAAVSSSAGCIDDRLPEEKAADALEIQISQRLDLEQRRLEAKARIVFLNAEYAGKVANLRKHYGDNENH
jgi:hypothetical protein